MMGGDNQNMMNMMGNDNQNMMGGDDQNMMGNDNQNMMGNDNQNMMGRARGLSASIYYPEQRYLMVGKKPDYDDRKCGH